MTDKDARTQLLDFLDQKAFQPVLKTSLDDYKNENQLQMLVEVQERTRSTRQRYHNSYTSAADVLKNFRSDLSSEAAKIVHADLRSLGLPALPEVKQEFEQLADELGVKG